MAAGPGGPGGCVQGAEWGACRGVCVGAAEAPGLGQPLHGDWCCGAALLAGGVSGLPRWGQRAVFQWRCPSARVCGSPASAEQAWPSFLLASPSGSVVSPVVSPRSRKTLKAQEGAAQRSWRAGACTGPAGLGPLGAGPAELSHSRGQQRMPRCPSFPDRDRGTTHLGGSGSSGSWGVPGGRHSAPSCSSGLAHTRSLGTAFRVLLGPGREGSQVGHATRAR